MKTEIRTAITEFGDSVDATFDLIEAIVADPKTVDVRLNGAMLRPTERRVETDENGAMTGSTLVFEVTLPTTDDKTPMLPEMERILVTA